MPSTTRALIAKASSPDLNSIYHLARRKLVNSSESISSHTLIALPLISIDLRVRNIMLVIVQGKSRLLCK